MKKRLTLAALAVITALNICGCALSDWVDAEKERLFPEETATAVEEEPGGDKPNIINTGVYDLDTFNPLITKSQSVKEAMQLVYEPLYTLDAQMRPVPVLAESCEKSEDGMTVILNIKQGITWHDGAPLTSEDVAYTFKMIRSGVTNYTSNLRHVADYIMAGDYSVKITLNSPAPAFEAMLTFPIVRYRTDMSVNPNFVPNGTGPFCYGTKTSVDEIYYGAYEGYHGGRPPIDSMYVHIVNSRDKYMTMLEASEIDFSSSEITDLTEYMPKGSLSLYDYPENRMVFLGFNMNNERLSGALTRKGISCLIDREEIVNSVIFSRGTASRVPVNPASYLYYDENTSFDSDELAANENFGNDGWGPDEDGRLERRVNGLTQRLTLEILANADNKMQSGTADSVAAHLNRFGVGATVTKLPYDAFISRVTSGNYDMFIGEAEIDANMELTPLTGPGNYFGYNNPGLDTISAQLGMTTDEEEIKALFRQYCEIVVNDMPFAVIYYAKGSLIASANVKSGFDPTYVWLYKGCSSWSVNQ